MVPSGFWIKPTRFRDSHCFFFGIPDSLLKSSAKPKSRSISTPPKQLQNKASQPVSIRWVVTKHPETKNMKYKGSIKGKKNKIFETTT